ncbi:Glycosyltransferase family 25 (LPS biosynthesis protein) [Caballeronia peredens]|nr:Glycosyltransferase family 25 (LPS biosynthesis protein) [Caballeronia peredens]
MHDRRKPSPQMKLDGFFINLDRSDDRRRSMEQQLADLGCDSFIKRYPGIDGLISGTLDDPAENGVRACRRSHTELILSADEHSSTVILEDDVTFSAQFPEVVNAQVFQRMLDDYPDTDLFFFECYPNPYYAATLLSLAEKQMPQRARADVHGPQRHRFTSLSVVRPTDIYNASAAAYLVTPKGKRTLRALFAAATDPATPIDILYQRWIKTGALNALLGVPFVAAPASLFRSTIAYPETPRRTELLLTHAVRRLMFAGDPEVDANALESLRTDVPLSPEYRLGIALFDQLWARNAGL